MNNEITINPKTQFVEDVKKWALVDSQLKIVNEKTKKMRELKNELSEKIRNYMSNTNIDKLKLNDGELRIYEKKEYSPLTFGYIEKTLSTIIADKEQLEYVIQYLKDNREITNSQDIKRTYHK
jgi:DNA repair ATPase RecN